MEQNHFMQNIEETYHSLTKVEKKVADYVLQNPRQVLFMSITDLADACQVGETSVYRFCRTMNLQGYQEFFPGSDCLPWASIPRPVHSFPEKAAS